jgi:hypothetical protein
MKAALALVFFACIAGSMATDARLEIFDQIFQQGQAVAQSLLGVLQTQLQTLLQSAVGQLTQLIAPASRIDIVSTINQLISQVKPLVTAQINQVLAQVLVGLQGFLGGRAELNLSAIFNDFVSSVTGALTGIGQHLLNQGLSAVLGAVGGARAFADIWAGITSQVSGLVSTTQAALTGALNNLAVIGAGIVDASKPHLETLQEQLIGHGLNALNSLSETINNFHGTLTGGR